MPNYPRIIAYMTASFTIGVIVYIFTGLFIPFAQTPGWTGTAVIVAYGAVYLSVTWSIARRFIRKTLQTFWLPYLMAPVILAPALFFIELKEEFALMQDQVIFTSALFIGSLLGAYFGIQYGHRMREELIRKAQEKQRDGK